MAAGNQIKKERTKALRHIKDYDMEINEDSTSVRILKADKNGLRLEVTKKGTVDAVLYKGTHWGTSVSTVNNIGLSRWKGKFMQVTDGGERIVGKAGGTGDSPDSTGFSKIKGRGTMWTKSARLSEWNGAGFTVDGLLNTSMGTTKVFVKFDRVKNPKSIGKRRIRIG